MRSFTIIIKSIETNRYTIEASGPDNIQVKPQPFQWPLTAEHRLMVNQLANDELAKKPEQLEAATQQLGQVLYHALFTTEIAKSYGQVQGKVGAQNLRLRLQIEPPELAALPWETMRSSEGWLALDSSVPLVRLLTEKAVRSEWQSLEVNKPLRILFVGASPSDITGKLEVEAQYNDLQRALAESSQKKDIALTPLFHPSRETLRLELLKNYHIIYFAGHGDPAKQEYDDLEEKFTEIPAVIYINEKDEKVAEKAVAGAKYGLTAKELAEMMKGPRNQVRLVFLAACNTSQSSGDLAKSSGDLKSPDDSPQSSAMLSGFAQDLTAQAHLPAIIAMQYAISNQQAVPLTAHFFAAIAQFNPVDVALAQARNAIVRQGQPLGRDVFAPVMYLQAENAALFKRAWNRAALGLAALLAVVLVIAAIGGYFLEGQRATEEQARLAAQTNEAMAVVTAEARGTSEAIAQATGKAEATQRVYAQETGQAEATQRVIARETANAEATGKAVEAKRADEEQKVAVSRRLANLANRYRQEGAWDKALLLGISSVLEMNTYEARNSIFTTLQTIPLKKSLWNYKNGVTSIVISPDGKILASGGKDGTIRLWDIATGQSLGEPLRGHKDEVNSISFSPDGKILASGSKDETIRLWDTTTGQSLGEPLENGDLVYSVTFSSDGKLLASGGYNSIQLWDVASRQSIGTPLRGHELWVWSVAFSPDGKLLASGSVDKTIRLWDVATRQQIGEPLKGHKHNINSITFSPDGKTLASGSTDYTIRLWDVATRQQIGEPLKGHEYAVNSVSFSPDGKTLGSVDIWEV